MNGARAVPFEGFFQEIGRFFLTLWRVFKWTPRRPWDWRELAVMALQTYTVLVRFNAEGFVASIVALSMVRELSCVIGGLIIAGRSGSAMAAELGTMRVTEQIDALETLATDPIHYLMVPRVWATTITAPLLIVLADAIGIVGGYLVAVVLMGANPVTYLNKTFQYMGFDDLFSGLIKAAVFGLLLATIGCQKGFYTRGGAEGVGRATTQAVVLASIAILVADFFLTKILF
jgi:phospholipid/cholesterol/gamma-HCH transport system permease protein